MSKKSYLYRYLQEIVFGASDGIITTFAVVAGFSGANNTANNLPYYLVLLFGFANLFADATSMGIGNYLAVRSTEIKNKKKDYNHKSIYTSLATFCAFIVFGLVPLLPYVLNIQNNHFFLSIIFTLAALILLGYFRGIIANAPITKSIVEVVTLGGTSALVAYLVGTLFKI